MAQVPTARDVQTSLDRCPERRDAWNALLRQTPAAERAAVTYLLAYMPESDLRGLPTSDIAQAAHLAVVARNATAWGKGIPEAIFLDAVVPYASVTEPRRSMRAEWARRYGPLVASTKSPGEAALLINARLFADTKVTYNTKRLRTDQSPPETISQGMATCTGLSIMLVDALRAVGVPSRLAGIPSWPGRGGNHTWVEVWDRGQWHFVGAAEPDAQGLDHAWFAEEAGRVPGDRPNESIYAVTFRPTGGYFPMVWEPNTRINAENVTARYRKSTAAVAPRLMVEVTKNGERVMADIVAVNAATGDQCLQGRSLGPHSDINLHLNAPAVEGNSYTVTAKYRGDTLTRSVTVKGDTVVRLNLDQPRSLAEALTAYFGGDADAKASATAFLARAKFDTKSADAVWQAFRDTPDAGMRTDMDANVVKTADRTSPYKWRTVGERPATGWGLVIAMHGGGGAPQELNDSQWEGMFRGYYKDHPEAGGYIYLALRAPNNEWDGFYDTPISPLIERLITTFVKYQDVDPNRVYAMGASHGGYGSFVIGPKIPYRFAAVHPAAGGPTPGRTAGENLRNLHFTWAIGEEDTAYGRIKINREFQTSWDEWRGRYGGFDGGMEEVKGAGHQIGAHEADQIGTLRKFARNPSPKRVIWVQTDDVLHRFYWLEALQPVDKGRIDAQIDGNTITVATENQGGIALWLSDRLVNLQRPIIVIRDGKRSEFRVKPNLETYAQGIAQTGDPNLSAPVRIEV